MSLNFFGVTHEGSFILPCHCPLTSNPSGALRNLKSSALRFGFSKELKIKPDDTNSGILKRRLMGELLRCRDHKPMKRVHSGSEDEPTHSGETSIEKELTPFER